MNIADLARTAKPHVYVYAIVNAVSLIGAFTLGAETHTRGLDSTNNKVYLIIYMPVQLGVKR